MGAPLTAFQFSAGRVSAGEDNCDLLVSARKVQGGTNMKTNRKDDLEDLPMAYLWYVVLAIMAIAATAVVLVIRLFWEA
jgi:hypothetical protein